MSSYYDDEEFGPIMRERDEDAVTDYITEKERQSWPQCSCGRPILGGEQCTHGCADCEPTP